MREIRAHHETINKFNGHYSIENFASNDGNSSARKIATHKFYVQTLVRSRAMYLSVDKRTDRNPCTNQSSQFDFPVFRNRQLLHREQQNEVKILGREMCVLCTLNGPSHIFHTIQQIVPLFVSQLVGSTFTLTRNQNKNTQKYVNESSGHGRILRACVCWRKILQSKTSARDQCPTIKQH